MKIVIIVDDGYGVQITDRELFTDVDDDIFMFMGPCIVNNCQ